MTKIQLHRTQSSNTILQHSKSETLRFRTYWSYVIQPTESATSTTTTTELSQELNTTRPLIASTTGETGDTPTYATLSHLQEPLPGYSHRTWYLSPLLYYNLIENKPNEIYIHTTEPWHDNQYERAYILIDTYDIPQEENVNKITEHLNTTTTSVEFFKTSNAPYHLYILDTTVAIQKEEHPSTTNTHHKGNEQGQPISCTYTHMRKQQSNRTSLT